MKVSDEHIEHIKNMKFISKQMIELLRALCNASLAMGLLIQAYKRENDTDNQIETRATKEIIDTFIENLKNKIDKKQGNNVTIELLLDYIESARIFAGALGGQFGNAGDKDNLIRFYTTRDILHDLAENLKAVKFDSK